MSCVHLTESTCASVPRQKQVEINVLASSRDSSCINSCFFEKFMTCLTNNEMSNNQLFCQCELDAQCAIGAIGCDDTCENTVLLETQGPCGSARRCRDVTATHDTWHMFAGKMSHRASSHTQLTASTMDLNLRSLYSCILSWPLQITMFLPIMLAANLDPTQFFFPTLGFITAMARENSAFVWMAVSMSNLSSTKDCQNCFKTYSLVNLALAQSWVFGHVRPVPSSKWIFFSFHASSSYWRHSSTASCGIPSTPWSRTSFILSENSVCSHGIDPGSIIGEFSCNRIRGAPLLSSSLSHTESQLLYRPNSFWHFCQTICHTQYDCVVDGFPKFQSSVVRQYTSLCTRQLVWHVSRFVRFISKWQHRCVHGIDCCKEACLSSFSNSDSTRDETSFAYGPETKRWSHVINITRQFVSNKQLICSLCSICCPPEWTWTDLMFWLWRFLSRQY